MPEVLQHLLCGRIVQRKTQAGVIVEGEVGQCLYAHFVYRIV